MLVKEPDRRTYLGSHGIAAVIGVDGAYRTKVGQYAYQAGIVDGPDDDEDFLVWGRILEVFILARFCDQNGVRMEDLDQHGETYMHHEYPYLGSTPDAIMGDKEKPDVVLDAKAVANYGNVKKYGDPESDQLPMNLLVQGGWHCAHSGANKCIFPVLFPANGWAITPYVYEADLEWQAKLVRWGVHFWKTYVIPNVAPELDHTPEARAILKHLYPEHTEIILDPTEETQALADTLRGHRDTAKDAKKLGDGTRNQLLNIIGEASGIAGLCKRTKNGQLRLV